MRILLTIAYEGTCYCGWQVQPNGVSIQALLQRAIETIVRHPINLTSAGRTDAGVHALGQRAHFDLPDASLSLEKLCYSVNALLPPDIRVMEASRVPDDFHARYSAMGKIYHYRLHLHPINNPFTRLYYTQILGSFDCSLLEKAARHFVGTHDFIAFANESHKGSASHDSVRTLKRLDIVEEETGLRLEFEGDGFLYKMVRNITGTLIDVAQKRLSIEEIPSLLLERDRRKAGYCAPAQGLVLVQVLYMI